MEFRCALFVRNSLLTELDIEIFEPREVFDNSTDSSGRVDFTIVNKYYQRALDGFPLAVVYNRKRKYVYNVPITRTAAGVKQVR